MHISEGVLSLPVLLSGWTVAVTGTAIGLKRMRHEQLPTVAVLSACFFVASLIHIPIGPSSVHLILSGLLGVVLGTSAFPAIMVALMLQAVLFQFGGITSLGVNTTTMALPAVISYFVFRSFIISGGIHSQVAAFLCGSLSILMSAVLAAVSLAASGQAFVPAAKLIILAHIPIMVVEGLITMAAVSFLYKVRPEVLRPAYQPVSR